MGKFYLPQMLNNIGCVILFKFATWVKFINRLGHIYIQNETEWNFANGET